MRSPTNTATPRIYITVMITSGAGVALADIVPDFHASGTIRVRDRTAEWADLQVGQPAADKVEVFGELAAGDLVAVRGTDENPIRHHG